MRLHEVAEHFGVCGKTIVERFVRERGLRGYRYGRHWRFDPADIAEFEARHAVGGEDGRRSA
jgi:excisionase family DNA binding protein